LGRKASGEIPKIQAGQRNYEDPRDLGKTETGWRSFAHPEGALYFCDTCKRVYTDRDIRSQKRFEEIQKCILELTNLAMTRNIAFPDHSLDLVLDIKKTKKNKKLCRYYFVDREKRLLFWIHDWEPRRVYENLQGVKEPTHIKKALEMQYWTHCELYPHKRQFDAAVIKELRGFIIHANAESITSETSLIPFDTTEVSKMMDIMDALEEATMGANPGFEPIICVIARFMRIFTRVQFLNFHGQPGARLDVDQSVYESSKQRTQRSTVLRILDLFLFGAPSRYSKPLRSVWVDHTVVQPRWRAFMTALNTEWTGFTIYSTVMLAVDVSFLGAPGVNSGTESFQSISAIAVYVSTLCTVGSLVASVILTGESRRSAGSTSDEMAQYMIEMTSSSIGIDHMAIMYSVPFGLLVWGMMFFLIAFTFVVFSSTYTPTLVTTGPAMVLVSIFVAWPLWVDVERFVVEHVLWIMPFRTSKDVQTRATRRDTGCSTTARSSWIAFSKRLPVDWKSRDSLSEISGNDPERLDELSRSSSLRSASV
ncbi:hypothetical protein V8B97DRAFT_1872600, partial [Scleroderma yunnanense]